MAKELKDHLATMTRRVVHGERDGKPAATVFAERVYPTSPDDLWDALTRAERLGRWFLPVSGDLREGGRYQFEGNAGGLIEECDRPNRIVATWEFGGGVSWLTLSLAPVADGTRLELRHEALDMPGFAEVYGPGAVGVGWDLGFMGLALHLQEPQAEVASEFVGAWATSDEAKELYRTSARAWARADIAAGIPEQQALAAAEQTRAFYSGELQPMGAPGAADEGGPTEGAPTGAPDGGAEA